MTPAALDVKIWVSYHLIKARCKEKSADEAVYHTYGFDACIRSPPSGTAYGERSDSEVGIVLVVAWMMYRDNLLVLMKSIM